MGMLAPRATCAQPACQHERQWVRWPAKLIDRKTVGIFGIGAIAEVLAPRCKALGMTVVGFSSPLAVPVSTACYARADLFAQRGELDYLVLLCPMRKTRGI